MEDWNTRKIAIYDVWDADDNPQGKELDIDVADWPPPGEKKLFTLRLEELTHFDIQARIEARERNLLRLVAAKQRADIAHLEVHHTCCADKVHRDALEHLLNFDRREWLSFTIHGINASSDFYTRPVSLEELSSLFLALGAVRALNLHSCALNRGHGLEAILKTIPFLPQLRQLRLQGWQMDRVSIDTLIEALHTQKSKAVTLLSLRSCSFLGEDTFSSLVNGFSSIEQLQTLNLSYCGLRDNDIIAVVRSMKVHPCIERLHIGGNTCVTTESVEAIAEWVKQESCKLQDLNLRALWINFSDDGLLQRLVDLALLFESLSVNTSLKKLTFSENYMENEEMKRLATALRDNSMLSYLDTGDNPFQEEGAEALLSLVRNCPTIESIRFENHYMMYECAEKIKGLVRFNYVDRRLLRYPLNIPMPLWPFALSKVQEGCGERFYSDTAGPDVLFRLLQASTGDFGLPLSLRIARA